MTRSERRFLKEVAKAAIDESLTGTSGSLALPGEGTLGEPGAAFVTLRTSGRLRGCIGMIGRGRSLASAVRDAARRAIHDPRFDPVRREEARDLEIEISVLTPFRRVSDPGEVEPGRHGLVISRGDRTGLLLPQVAAEHGWDREQFLSQTSVKAGLAAGDWRLPDTRIEVFEAEVF